MVHKGDFANKVQEARDTLALTDKYMTELGREFEKMKNNRITEAQVDEYIEQLLPMETEASPIKTSNIIKLRDSLRSRYYDAPDLIGTGNNQYRFINAVSDFATHSQPLRRTASYQENIFLKTIEGNPIIDRAYQLMVACAEQIAKQYFKSDKEKSIELMGVDEDLRRREELVGLIDKLEKEKATIEQKVQLQMEDAAYGISSEYRVSWVTTESKRLDTKKLKEEQPEMYNQYSNISSCRRFTVRH